MPAPTSTPPHTISGRELRSGDAMRSANGAFRAVMQSDGNFVEYDASGRALWATGTGGRAGAFIAMQGDGNLVVYHGGRAVWASNTAGQPGTRLTLQDDGNLVLFAGGHPVWSRTDGYLGDTLRRDWWLRTDERLYSSNGAYMLIMQGDSNLVLYQGGRALWATGTNGAGGASAVMQGDGNFVLYRGGAIWDSRTTGRGGDRLVVQNDGNVVIYAGGTAVWARSTGVIGGGGGGGGSAADRAAGWAAAQVGQTRAPGDVAALFSDWAPGPYGEWSGDCAKFAIASWRAAGVSIARGNAVDQYNAYRGRIQGGTPPRGALVFWPNVTQWGHIAIADGSGGVYTTRGLDGANLPIQHIPASTFGAPAGWVIP